MSKNPNMKSFTMVLKHNDNIYTLSVDVLVENHRILHHLHIKGKCEEYTGLLVDTELLDRIQIYAIYNTVNRLVYVDTESKEELLCKLKEMRIV